MNFEGINLNVFVILALERNENKRRFLISDTFSFDELVFTLPSEPST